MTKVLLKNTNPLGYVDAPILGRVGLATDVDENGKPLTGSGCLKPGEVVEVDETIAGSAPYWRPATSDDNEAIRLGHIEHRTAPEQNDPDGEYEFAPVEVRDLGHGLLAQVGNFELVDQADPLKGLTLDGLKAYAEEHGIDLDGATTKADITAAIRAKG